MKLVRLATENNGVFSSAFDNDMIIAKDSKMALLNLTFQSNLGSYVIIPPNSTASFKSDASKVDTLNTITLPNKSYTVDQQEDFFKDIQHALNSTLKNEDSRGGGNRSYNSVCSAFRIGTNTGGGEKTVEYRYAPFINPITSFASLLTQQMIYNSDYILPVFTQTGGPEQIFTTYTKKPSEPATSGRAYKIIPLEGRRLNDGSSMFTARVADSTDNSSGQEDNGFGIGLSSIPFSGTFDPTSEIPIANREFEIRFNRIGETYKYIENLSNEKDSGRQPEKVSLAVDADVNTHDVLFMEVSGNILELGVYQDDGAGQRRVFTRVQLTAGAELYPYMYIRGASTDVKVDAFNFSIDPWLPTLGGDNEGNSEWKLTGAEDTARDNAYDNIFTGNIKDVMTQCECLSSALGGSERFDNDVEDVKGSLVMNSNVWRGLGFNQFQATTTNQGFQNFNVTRTNPQPFWKRLYARVLPAGYTSDNFLIESMSLPLDSFDASKTQYPVENEAYVNPSTDKKGRRKNILMTIPVNDNTSGLVEYESSTPIFIDINNAEDINAKNLNFRILNKDFGPIFQSPEASVMTILIKKPNE